jgi:hypothetical protein
MGIRSETEIEIERDNARLAARKLLKAIDPFVRAATTLEPADKSSWDLWEHSSAMEITIGDLRSAYDAAEDARKLLSE